MREIQSLTLDRARTAEKVDALFANRRTEFDGLIGHLVKAQKLELEAVWLDDKFRSSGAAMRCSGVPLMPIEVEHITERLELRIGTQPARVRSKIAIPGQPSELGIRSWDIAPVEFQPALRGWSYVFQSPHYPLLHAMRVRSDGLVERVSCDLRPATVYPDGRPHGLHFDQLLAFVLTVVTSIEVFRTRTGTNEVPYELEFELIAKHGQALESQDGAMRGEIDTFMTRRVLFPRLLIGRRESLAKVGEAVQTDIWNAASQRARIRYDFDVERSVSLHS